MQQAHGQGGSHRAPLAGPPPAPGGGPVSGPLPGGGVWIDLEQFEVLLIGEQRRALCEVEPAAAVHAAKKMMQSFRDQECFKGRQLLQVLLYFTGAVCHAPARRQAAARCHPLCAAPSARSATGQTTAASAAACGRSARQQARPRGGGGGEAGRSNSTPATATTPDA